MAEVSSFVTLSTATLEEAVSDMLSEMGEDSERRAHWGDWRDDVYRCGFAYGHWVQVARLQDEEKSFGEAISRLPLCLQNGMHHAQENGASWILYDRDGDDHGLPTFPW